MRDILCLECGAPLDRGALDQQGIVQCSDCGTRFVPTEAQALTYVDEIPESEYLGG